MGKRRYFRTQPFKPTGSKRYHYRNWRELFTSKLDEALLNAKCYHRTDGSLYVSNVKENDSDMEVKHVRFED